MSGKYDPQRMHEFLSRFYSEAQTMHQATGSAVVEVLNWLQRRAQADAEFLSAFGHLIQPPPAAQRPPQGPPPVPPASLRDEYPVPADLPMPEERSEQLRRWEEAVGRREPETY